MKSTLISLCLLAGANLMAQDTIALLPPTSTPASSPLQIQPQNRPYTMRWGDFRLLAGASLQGEWNDNITLNNQNKEQDFILRPQVTLQGTWPITQVNSIDFILGAGYEAYLQHSEFSRLLITPGSVLSFNFQIGDYRLNLHDRVTYVNDPSLYGNVSGVARLGGLFNTSGFDISHDFKEMTATIGYDHQIFISSSSGFNSLNYSSDLGTARLAYNFDTRQMAGLEAGGGRFSYSQTSLSDYDTVNAGAFTDWQLTRLMALIVRAGYVDHLYATPALTQGHSTVPGYYVIVGARGSLNPSLAYNLEGGRQETVSVDGGLLQEWYASFTGQYEIIRNGFLSAGVRYENAHQPFENVVEGPEFFSPHYDRVLFQTTFSYPIARKVAAVITYNFLIKDASNDTANYTVNDVLLGLTYNL